MNSPAPQIRSALLAIDFQTDFLDAQGRWPVAEEDAPKILAAVNRLLLQATKAGVEVIYIANEYSRWQLLTRWSLKGAATKGQAGVELDKRLALVSSTYFAKRQCDAFHNVKLDRYLREHQVRQVILTGVFASECIRHTAQGARQRGYQVTVVSDAVADADQTLKAQALTAMAAQGIRVIPADQVFDAIY